MATTQANQFGIQPKATSPAAPKLSKRQEVLKAFIKAAKLESQGRKDKKQAIGTMLTLPGVKHGTKITNPDDGTLWIVENVDGMSDPKARAWDALMASDLPREIRKEANRIFVSLQESKTTKNIKKI